LTITAPTTGYAENAPTLEPIEVVRKATEQVLAVARQRNLSPVDRYEIISQTMPDYVDIESISRFVLGRHWRNIDDKQREQFNIGFRRLLVNKYLEIFSEHTDAHIKYIASLKRSSVKMIISEITGYDHIEISYNLHKKAGKWKIYNVIVEGISLLTSYRSGFNYKIKRNGIDELIGSLVENTRN
jgi:phospholipid transport system substrate-binding protein